MENGQQAKTNGAEVFDPEYNASFRSLQNSHFVYALREVINLLEIEHIPFLDLIGSEVSSSFAILGFRESVSVHNQYLPSFLSCRPVAEPLELRNCADVLAQVDTAGGVRKSCGYGHQRRKAHFR